ncbi:MAG: hypothetical protein LBF67_05240 [Prevotellaceae bacterium]|nr:hypothetical protein [Prevotellaceae bacterium]
MKKIILSLSMCLSIAAAAAQEQNSSYLPEAGDFALGVDASPFFRYMGNFLSSAGNNNTPGFTLLQDQGVYGKYFLSDDRAIRIKLLLDIYSTSNKQSVLDNEALSTTPDATTIDTRKIGVTDVSLSVGYELRRGRGRVQGFWGGELALGLGRTSTTYEYGNPMTVATPNPFTGFGLASSPRTLESKGGLSFIGGVCGFVGVEYFIANQVSLGGEFSLGLGATIRGQDEVTSQRVTSGEVRESVVRSRDGNEVANIFGIKTMATGSVFLLFHF